MFIYEPEVYFRAIDNFRTINRNKPSTTDEILKISSPKESISFSHDGKEREKALKKLAENILSK